MSHSKYWTQDNSFCSWKPNIQHSTRWRWGLQYSEYIPKRIHSTCSALPLCRTSYKCHWKGWFRIRSRTYQKRNPPHTCIQCHQILAVGNIRIITNSLSCMVHKLRHWHRRCSSPCIRSSKSDSVRLSYNGEWTKSSWRRTVFPGPITDHTRWNIWSRLPGFWYHRLHSWCPNSQCSIFSRLWYRLCICSHMPSIQSYRCRILQVCNACSWLNNTAHFRTKQHNQAYRCHSMWHQACISDSLPYCIESRMPYSWN